MGGKKVTAWMLGITGGNSTASDCASVKCLLTRGGLGSSLRSSQSDTLKIFRT